MTHPETYARDSDKIEIPAEWIESGKQGEILYNNKALRFVCNKTLDAFVAELEKVINQSLGIYPSEMKYKLLTELKYDIKQTAKRMKGEV